MRIAFLGHSYHRLTGSSRFMQAILLARLGAVEVFEDESWQGGAAVDVAAVLAGGFDAIHVWQMEQPLEALVAARPGVPIYWYPMQDSARHLGPAFWSRTAPGARIIAFCRAVHEDAVRRGLDSAWFQYFPDPSGVAPVGAADGVFCWPRREAFGWPLLKRLLPLGFSGRLHLHDHPDPGSAPPALPDAVDIAAHGITQSRWFEDRGALDRLLGEFLIYVAPRLHEGIGMAFLEALARGQCVVAADRATMNEYITDGVNGLLFDPDRPRPLDFARAVAMGARARELVALGHVRWQRDAAGRLLDALTAPPGTRLRALAEPFPA
ncbi:glycosyltransferase [Plastoroseomonas arctica]|uniref:Glycosyltransferase family 4 protein n=1 Tax=Plastoroseomonas arctica TaxID=1509237 RepID=A0AAF1K569_9PROT|nr:glycosyltransferase [Plastoroseomonas arctica]MBR0656259.1 glycosyltransferase family 4 protein [Plastoroseomonas arctica]